MSFLSAHPALRPSLESKGYTVATQVQTAILDSAGDRDLLVSARTGSGKTVAFGLSMATNLLGEAERFGPPKAPLALVIAPTRELAQQVQRELYWLYAPAGARIMTCVGGMDIRREHRMLQDGVHIVVGTPGRLCDHLDRGTLDLSQLRVLVLDEADEMLDMGFRDELELLLKAAPPERRTLMFSATMPKEIERLASQFQKDALRIATVDNNQPHEDISYRAVAIAPREREHAVVNILRFVDAPSALVFCATREGVTHMHANLSERGFSAVALSGQLSQAERNRALTSLRDGRARVLVATDVAARGLDLPALDLVIHADLPPDPQVLLHRSGRTGRAGRKGVCAVLVPNPRRRAAERLFKGAKIELAWSMPPDPEQIRVKDDQRLISDLTQLALEATEEDTAVAAALLEKIPAQGLIAAFVRQIRAQWPSPEDLPETLRTAQPAAERAPSPKTLEAPGVWFRVNIGKMEKAHPLWLIPMICRRGRIEKSELGRIEILGRETRFEVSQAAADRFDESAQRPDQKEPQVRFQRLNGAGVSKSPRNIKKKPFRSKEAH